MLLLCPSLAALSARVLASSAIEFCSAPRSQRAAAVPVIHSTAFGSILLSCRSEGAASAAASAVVAVQVVAERVAVVEQQLGLALHLELVQLAQLGRQQKESVWKANY